MRYWALSVILVVTFLVQSVVSDYLAIQGITPNLLLVMVVCYGLLFGWQVGLGAGAIGGLLLDLTVGRFIGLHVLSLGAVGFGVGLVEERIFKDNLLLAPAVCLIGSLAHQTIIMLIYLMFGRPVMGSFQSTILPAALYDMVLSVFVYARLYRHYLYLRPDPRGTIEIRRHS